MRLIHWLAEWFTFLLALAAFAILFAMYIITEELQ